jgi:DNA-binding transcriptional ArsR family regulator
MTEKKYSTEELDAVFHSLANSTRRKILARLCQQPHTISELAEPFDMSLAAISKHIKVLEKAGLLRKEREGTILRCYITPAPAVSAGAFVNYLEES